MIKTKFNKLIIKGLKEGISDIEYVRGKMINTYILIYATLSFFLLVIRCIQGQYLLSLINVFLISQTLIAYLLSIKKSHQVGAIYFLCLLLVFQTLLLLSSNHITALLYIAALPLLFTLLFDNTFKRNTLFLINFFLTLLYYYHHNSSYNFIFNSLSIICIFYFIASKFIVLTEKIQKSLNKALQEKQLIIEKLHNKNKELEQFNYLTSHDLQEPLKTITTFSNLIKTNKNNQLDKISKDGLMFMDQAANRMTSLIDDLFNYSRIGIMSELGPVDIAKVIILAKKDLQQEFNEKQAKINHEALPVISGYEKELILLFHCLFSNALKFSNKEKSSLINIYSKTEADVWQFTVKDNGIGIEIEDYNRLFKMFYRLHPKNSYVGNGAGLAHCQKIIELHDGKIWVESNQNEGSSFHFTINKKLVKK